MRYEIAAETAADVSRIVTLPLEEKLSSTALKVFRALHTVAVEAAAARGYSPGVSEVVIFAPAELVARAVGIHPSTLYRRLPELADAGLVDARGHYCSLRGRTRSDGTLWAVRLRPVGGRRARLGYDVLKARHRDLRADIDAGRTAWAMMRESRELPSREIDLSSIRRFALPPSTTESPLRVDSRTASRRTLESILDVPVVERGERSAAVNLAAEALATALRDRAGVNYYRKLLWQLTRRLDATGDESAFHVVYEQARRAAAESGEGYGRKPGALLVSRLKRARWYEEAMNAPPSRVGSAVEA
jgi:DNA-binding transcriptional ArsR family regulator